MSPASPMPFYEIASEHPALNTPESMANAVLALARVIEEKAELAMEKHSAEWDAVVKQKRESVDVPS